MGALIDPGNPVIPFIGGTLIGILVGGPVIDAIGGMFGESDAAYAYHGHKWRMHGGGGMHGHGMHGMHAGHGQWGHKQWSHGMDNVMYHPPRLPAKHGVPRAYDFEKQYTNVEQTYTNHVFIRDKTPYL